MQIEIRTRNQDIGDSQRDFIERRLFFTLGRFGHRIRRVIVRLEDMNKPPGGLDKRCHIEVRMPGRSALVVDVRDIDLEPALSRAAERIARRVRERLNTRRVQRQRGTPSVRIPLA